MEFIKEEAIITVLSLLLKYENNPYMLSKTQHYIKNQLPQLLETMNTTHIERQARIEELSQNQDQFIESFLNNNQYFYVSSTENFFFYDGIHYQLYNEDDILYHILSTISKEKELSSWKQSTKNTIMKRIRESSLLKSIPESETIQFAIDSLCPILFQSRTEAKYFLTILGDNILRKNTNIIHYIDVKSKHFIRNFNNFCQMWIGQSLYQSFKHKYHDHDYNDCRIVQIGDYVKSDTVWNAIITKCGLDILCVACHYSERYTSSDNYLLQSSNNSELISSVFYLKNNSTSMIIDRFIAEYLDLVPQTNQVVPQIGEKSHRCTEITWTEITWTEITWRDMQYLWKQFLESNKLPSIMFLQTLKTGLVQTLATYYQESTDSFVGICSKRLPEIQKFLEFWQQTVVVDENEMDMEIDEIVILFRRWCTLHQEATTTLNEKQILDIISYFYPSLEIEKDKFIPTIRNTLWDKQLDIQVALNNLKVILLEKNNKNNVSIYDAYRYYCKYYVAIQPAINRLIVSKSYFEKYVTESLPQFVVDSKFLSVEWYKTN